MEATNKKITLGQAQDLLEDSTLFKMEFVEEIFIDFAIAGRTQLSGGALQGLHIIMKELRGEVNQVNEAICNRPKGEEVAA